MNLTCLAVAAMMSGGLSVNVGKVVPYHAGSSPFTNLWTNRSAIRNDGFHYLDLTGPSHVEWNGPAGGVTLSGPTVSPIDGGDRHTDYTIDGTQTVKVSVADGVENLRICSGTTCDNATFRDEFLAAIRPFETLRMLEWTSANYSSVTDWASRPKTGDGWGFQTDGVPPEIMVELANLTGKQLWLTMPHTATADYHRGFARLLRDELDPAVGLIVEFSNEVWNPDFVQFDSAANYGRNANSMFQIYESILGKDRVTTMLAGQAVNTSYLETALSAVANVDAVSIAAYVRVDPGDMDDVYSLFREGERPADLIFDLLYENLGKRLGYWESHSRIAEIAGVPLMAYEAGQSLLPWGKEQRNDSEFVDWLNDLQSDYRMGNLYHDIELAWGSVGGDEIAWYQLSERPSKSGFWGLRENILGSSIKWDAVTGGMFDDRVELPSSIIINSTQYFAGDSNYDGVFDSSDLVQIFAAGKYETNGEAYWAAGDWNHDRQFNSSDLITAFRDNRYEMTMLVPEPGAAVLWLIGVAASATCCTRRTIRCGR